MYITQTWKEFSDAGMLWFTNRILHVFGWVIVIDEKGNVFPARTNVLGFVPDLDAKRRDDFIHDIKKDEFVSGWCSRDKHGQ